MRHYESDSILNIKPPIDIEDIADRTIKVEYDYDFVTKLLKRMMSWDILSLIKDRWLLMNGFMKIVRKEE